jgi:hypothetical protein
MGFVSDGGWLLQALQLYWYFHFHRTRGHFLVIVPDSAYVAGGWLLCGGFFLLHQIQFGPHSSEHQPLLATKMTQS